MVTTHFCPRCWFSDTRPFEHCPCCGHDLLSEKDETYEERLISALSHPIREQQMIAIEILGRLRYHKAVPRIAKLLETERDYYLIRECILALRAMGGVESERILVSLAMHPSPMVRELVSEYRDSCSPEEREREGASGE